MPTRFREAASDICLHSFSHLSNVCSAGGLVYPAPQRSVSHRRQSPSQSSQAPIVPAVLRHGKNATYYMAQCHRPPSRSGVLSKCAFIQINGARVVLWWSLRPNAGARVHLHYADCVLSRRIDRPLSVRSNANGAVRASDLAFPFNPPRALCPCCDFAMKGSFLTASVMHRAAFSLHCSKVPVCWAGL